MSIALYPAMPYFDGDPEKPEFPSMKRIILILLCCVPGLQAQQLPLPPRSASASSGSAIAAILTVLSREDREARIRQEVLAGNVPDFLRTFVKVTYAGSAGGTGHTVSVWVTPDYLALGSNDDLFLMPMSPILAQQIANALSCTLPTKLLVDRIYTAAQLKLRPQPIPPSAEMITIPVFWQHNDSVKALRQPQLNAFPLGSLIGGTKKDVIISNKIYQNLKSNVPSPVVIYGWHQLNGQPIQPVYNGHVDWYADYSHGIRLLWNKVLIDADTLLLTSVMASPTLADLVSDEGPIAKPYYTVPTGVEGGGGTSPEGYRLEQNFPNPFNPETRITSRVPRRSHVRLSVYDILGRELARLGDGIRDAGTETTIWNADVGTGVYFCRMEAVPLDQPGSRYVDVKEMVLLR